MKPLTAALVAASLAVPAAGQDRLTREEAERYAKLCVDRWSHWYAKPVILTGQAYAADAFTNDKVAKKLDEFAAGFSSWSSIAGLNWWHFGAMTQEMRSTIAKLK